MDPCTRLVNAATSSPFWSTGGTRSRRRGGMARVAAGARGRAQAGRGTPRRAPRSSRETGLDGDPTPAGRVSTFLARTRGYAAALAARAPYTPRDQRPVRMQPALLVVGELGEPARILVISGVSPRRSVRLRAVRARTAAVARRPPRARVARRRAARRRRAPPPAHPAPARPHRAASRRASGVRVGVALQDVPRRDAARSWRRRPRLSAPKTRRGRSARRARGSSAARRRPRVGGVQVRASLDDELADAYAVVLRGDDQRRVPEPVAHVRVDPARAQERAAMKENGEFDILPTRGGRREAAALARGVVGVAVARAGVSVGDVAVGRDKIHRRAGRNRDGLGVVWASSRRRVRRRMHNDFASALHFQARRAAPARTESFAASASSAASSRTRASLWSFARRYALSCATIARSLSPTSAAEARAAGGDGRAGASAPGRVPVPRSLGSRRRRRARRSRRLGSSHSRLASPSRAWSPSACARQIRR